MGSVKVENIRLYAYHGCLKEEAIIGCDYRVDVSVNANLSKAAQTDALEDTVDYVHINHIVKTEMKIPSQLLEHVAQRINNRILKELRPVTKVKTSIAKINPPIGGDVQTVKVTLSAKRS